MIGRTVIKYQFVAFLMCIGGQVNAAEQCENMDITNDEGKQTLIKYMQEKNAGIIVSISTTVIDGQSNSKSMFDTTKRTDGKPITSTITENHEMTQSKFKTTLAQEPSTTATKDDETTTKTVSDQTTLESTTHAQPTTTATNVEPTTSEIDACHHSHFKFPRKNHMDYVQYKGRLPQLEEFTACVWLRPEEIGSADSYGVMSYCAEGSDDCETLLARLSNLKITVSIDEESSPYNFGSEIKVRQWTYSCIVMSPKVSQHYINGLLNFTTTKTLHEVIPNGGLLILGNLQRNQINGFSPGEPKDGSHGFFGEMKGFQLWNRELTGNEIEDLFKSGRCSCKGDSIVKFNKSNSVIKGNVTDLRNTQCP